MLGDVNEFSYWRKGSRGMLVGKPSVEGRHVTWHLPDMDHSVDGCPAPGKVGPYFEKRWCTVGLVVHRCFSAHNSAYLLDNPGRSTIS